MRRNSELVRACISWIALGSQIRFTIKKQPKLIPARRNKSRRRIDPEPGKNEC